ncbi:MAG: FecR domain-containing protein [Anaerolineae bacterium]
MMWRQNPTRVAWAVLLTSFLLCCLLAVGVPLGTRSFVLHATRAKTAFVESTQGTIQLWQPEATDPRAVTERRPVAERSRLMTDATAKGVLTLAADESGSRVLVTVQLSPQTAISLDRVRSPRFGLSQDPHQVKLTLKEGRLFITAQRLDDRDLLMQITTPHASITLGNGTFDLIVDKNQTQVRARSGAAQVEAAGQAVNAGPSQRVNVVAGLRPTLPVPDMVNLVLNGAFETGLEPLWEVYSEVKPGHQPGRATVVEDERRRAVRFSRREEDGVPNRVGIIQTVNRDVQNYDSLTLELDLKIRYQSVPGGGERATEYPVMIDLFYTDVYGKDLHWYQGFYSPYQTLPPNYLPPTGETVPLGIWYTYESPNLFELLSATRPAQINSINIYATGHDYESLVANVALTVR